MATYTTNYNLKKPATTDYISISDINGNMDTIDAEMNGLRFNKYLTSSDDLDTFLTQDTNGFYYAGQNVQNAPSDWCSILSIMSGGVGHQFAMSSAGRVYVRSRSGSPLAWSLWYAFHGSYFNTNAGTIGTVKSGTAITTTVATGSRTNIMSITLEPGVYVLTGGFTFTESFSGITYGTLMEDTDILQGTLVRSTTQAGNGYNASFTIVPSSEKTFYLAAYQSSGSSRTVQGVRLRSVRIA